MPNKYVVELIQTPKVNDFRSDYFPRRFHYKKDALALIHEVATKGGVARLAEKGTDTKGTSRYYIVSYKHPNGELTRSFIFRDSAETFFKKATDLGWEPQRLYTTELA